MTNEDQRQKLLKEAQALLQRAVGSIEPEALDNTPQRFADWQEDVFVKSAEQYSRQDVHTFPDGDYSALSLIVVRVSALSACEHHYAPAILRGTFGYAPQDVTIGYSKIGKMFKHFASRYTMDERIVSNFLAEFDDVVRPRGSAMLLRGLHTCVIGRGGSDRDPVSILGTSGVMRESESALRTFFAVAGPADPGF